MLATSVEPILAVPDVSAAVGWYESVLGFTGGWIWGDPVVHGGVRSGSISLQFTLDPDLAARSAGAWYAFFTDDPDESYALHHSAGADIISPLENKPWGLREYTVRDLNGYRLRIGGPAQEERRSGSPITGVVLEFRTPTPAEMGAVIGLTVAEAEIRHALSLTGAVAFLNDEPVAVARVVQEHPAWLSVWDVHVRADLQGRRIGTQLMAGLIQHLRAEFPGAMLHLFTVKPDFYARVGFAERTVTMMQL